MTSSPLTVAQQAVLLREHDKLQAQLTELQAAHGRIAQERDQVTQERDQVTQERDQVTQERDEYKKLYVNVREAYELAKLGILEQKAERLPKNDAQLTLAILALALGGDQGVTEETTASASDDGDGDGDDDGGQTVKISEDERKKRGRAPLPAHIPRVTVELLPPEVERQGLDAFQLIGTETREVLERRPASHIVVQIIRKKFKRKADTSNCTSDGSLVQRADSESEAAPEVTLEGQAAPSGPELSEPKILIAPLPELPIARGRAGPGLLAATIVYRWQDHLPLHRLQGFFEREGMALPKSTLCDWHIELALLAQPLTQAMKADALLQPILLTDATGVLVLAKERCRRGHFWVLVAPGRHVLFEFSSRHDGAAVDQLLPNYSGYLVADAHPVYDHLYREQDIIEVGCWSHTRRYFIKAMDSEPERSRVALALIGALFRIERSIATAPRKKKEAIRKKKSLPVLERFFAWCDQQHPLVLDESPLERALTYATNQRQALHRFVYDGRLPLHNNTSERALRREAVGRKNWLFLASEDGALANTTFVTLLASCQLHGIEPWSYLRDLFCLLPSWPASRVLELAPVNWKQTLKQEHTQTLLHANVFRRATLELDS